MQNRLTEAIEKLKKLGYDAYASDGDSLIHFRLPISQMNQKYYDKINRDLERIGWNKSWGCVGKGI